MSLMFEPLRRYADFEGRSRRTEYWLFFLFHVLVAVAFTIVTVTLVVAGAEANKSQGQDGVGAAFVVWILVAMAGALALIIPTLAVHVRRLHDIDQSGWMVLLGLIPGVGGIILLVFHLMDGTPGPNRYGEDPKGRLPYGAGPTVHHHHYAPGAEPPAV
ncbi:DUF805 domain-containing protein [Caulobacter sp. CCG-8]|uniref:DUF805 domain-containing protein n=1 Tax=Caulobacter sp. CCG-8 TaxID=3127958 RepID=UPI00307CF8D9